ncbi:hypothetical protein BV25DRAFT_300632 [Artomyces pyxidatus]|uniref:Uncharacterized protein n=1 Tax=Artomyces pyxidatus TaxID=48021 RepID=A0ACB8T821_9AGAM|nr:hypothetical protein BV25DRAFT_300632 [Artomyces pyxidatus]
MCESRLGPRLTAPRSVVPPRHFVSVLGLAPLLCSFAEANPYVPGTEHAVFARLSSGDLRWAALGNRRGSKPVWFGRAAFPRLNGSVQTELDRHNRCSARSPRSPAIRCALDVILLT